MPESKQDKRLSLREAMAYNARGLSMWWKAMPQYIITLSAMQVLTALTPYVPLYFTARLINGIASGNDTRQLWGMLALLLISTAAVGALLAAVKRRNEALESECYPTWKHMIFEKLLKMDFCDVDDPKTQQLLARINENANYMGWGLPNIPENFGKLINGVFRILGAAALSVRLFTQSVTAGGKLAWLNHPMCLAGMVVLLILTTVVSPWLSNQSIRYWSQNDGAAGNRYFNFFYFVAMEQRFRGTDIRMYEQDAYIRDMGTRRLRQGDFGPDSWIGRAARGRMGLLVAASEVVNRLFTGIVYLFVGLKAVGGAFGVGSVTQYVGSLAGLAAGVSMLLETIGNMRENAEFLRPVYQLLDMPNSMYQGSLTTEKRSDRKYEIEFRDVSFKYPGADTWALRHMSMKFRIGERLAVVGENGSGKTTFIKLLCRLYDPTEGQILLNGIDIRKYRYDDYLALFSVVFQDFQLLSMPLGQNVAASAEYDRERTRQCLEKAGFGARLKQMPNGLDTYLYRDFMEDGVEVSGGEAQKIALARVLYQDAPFIVLDEPTAALDPEAEMEIYHKFNDIVEDKTAVYISHRLSSCRFCDEIAVFDHGEMIQQGTHDALLSEKSGKYRALWEAQAQYYRKKEIT